MVLLHLEYVSPQGFTIVIKASYPMIHCKFPCIDLSL